MDLFPLLTLMNQWPGRLFFQPNSYFQTQGMVLYEDGRITSYPQNVTQFDRSTHLHLGLDMAQPITGSVLIRGQAKAHYKVRSISEDEMESESLKSKTLFLNGDAYLSILTEFQAELALGVGTTWVPTYKENIFFGVSGTKTYPQVFLASPHLVIIKRSGSWSAGFFYHGSSHKERRVQFSLSNGSERKDLETVSRPPAFGLLAHFSWLSNATTELEALLVEASKDSQKNPDGKPTYRDYGAISSQTYIQTGSYRWGIGVSYKDSSYATQASSELPTLSQTGLRATVAWGTGVAYHLGAYALLSSERQSLPELNAKMSNTVYGVFAGLNWKS